MQQCKTAMQQQCKTEMAEWQNRVVLVVVGRLDCWTELPE